MVPILPTTQPNPILLNPENEKLCITASPKAYIQPILAKNREICAFSEIRQMSFQGNQGFRDLVDCAMEG
jgi:hypothetical protein